MDDNTAQPQTNQAPASQDDASNALLEILKGNVPKVIIKDDPNKQNIIKAPKLSNGFVERFVKNAREEGNLDDSKILDVLIRLDKQVEEGDLTEKDLTDL